MFDPEKGLAMAFMKKVLGNKGHYFETVKKWVPEEYYEEPAEATCNIKLDGGVLTKLAKELSETMGTFNLSFKTPGKPTIKLEACEVKMAEDPCVGCDRGWGGSDGRSCYDECEVRKDYIESLKEDK